MDFWLYFGFVYGILFDGRIHASLSTCSAEFVCFASNPPSHEIHENFHENTKTNKVGL
jgi:hypothetical protein